jgi:hypothetical protein
MRRLLVVALAMLAAAPATAHAVVGWSSPVALPGASGQATDFFSELAFAGDNGLASWPNNIGSVMSVSATTNGAASWGSAPTTPNLPDRVKFAFDGAGNRYFAWVSGTNRIKLLRAGATGGVNAAGAVELGPATTYDARDMSLAVNPAGDMLLLWTNVTSASSGRAIFWAHDAVAPNAAQVLTTTGSSGASPVAVLDPDRKAVVAFQDGQTMVQASTNDANATDPFGGLTPLSNAGQVGGARGAQAPDGRAAIAWYAQTSISTNQYGSNSSRKLYGAVRGPGQTFSAPAQIDGAADYDAGYTGGIDVAVSATGRAIVGYGQTINNGVTQSCETVQAYRKTALATAQITPQGGGGLAGGAIFGGADVGGNAAHVAAGSDDRLGATFLEFDNCTGGPTAFGPGAAFSKDATPAIIADPPQFPGLVAFRGDGKMVALVTAAGQAYGAWSSSIYDPEEPVDPPDNGGGGTTPPVTTTPTPPPPPQQPLPRAPGNTPPPKPSNVSARNDGSVVLTYNLQSTGSLLVEAYARRGLLAAVPKGNLLAGSVTKRVTKAGTLKVTLKPNSRAKKRLRKAKKLKVTMRSTFTPTVGVKPPATTTTATLKLKRR